MNKAVVIISGGLDSSTLAHYAAAHNFEVHGISFNYGQRHNKELMYAGYQMAQLGQNNWRTADISFMKDLLSESGSSLVTDEDVPEGHYGEESMKKTVVPNRNMIMLSIAAGYAVSIGASALFTGVHAGDHFIYPDCRPEFIRDANAAVVRGNYGFGPFACLESGIIDYIKTPFIDKTKNDIAEMAFALNVDIANTWSCYKGGDLHCGRCGTCVERLEAINSTGKPDPTPYQDDTFWREALRRNHV